MKTKFFLTTIAILSGILTTGCDNLNLEPSPSGANPPQAANQNLASISLETGSLAGVNLGVAGNFAILSKSGITDVYKSDITGDVGTSRLRLHLSILVWYCRFDNDTDPCS